ncbi:helix-turn-helix domain-containing protein [Rhodococcus jostii]|uniref:helix-turn-helix domain-containing protein n=1 Tax=Rhodococcus jostii TaxID=132919 RepID=UPI003640399E
MSTSADTHDGWVPTDSLANRLVLVRNERKLSQRAAADLCGLTFGEWQGMEVGRGVRRVDQKVVKIAKALGVDRDWLMWGGHLAELLTQE